MKTELEILLNRQDLSSRLKRDEIAVQICEALTSYALAFPVHYFLTAMIHNTGAFDYRKLPGYGQD